jgi:hypothetical protein
VCVRTIAFSGKKLPPKSASLSSCSFNTKVSIKRQSCLSFVCEKNHKVPLLSCSFIDWWLITALLIGHSPYCITYYSDCFSTSIPHCELIVSICSKI